MDNNQEDDDASDPPETASTAITTTTAELQNQLKRAQRECRSLHAYNCELRDQIELMNAKLHLAKDFLYQNAATQTDIPGQQINVSVFSGSAIDSNNQRPNDDVNGGEEANENCQQQKKINFDLQSLLSDMKSDNLVNSDYTYDAVSKTYLSRSTGWYYYPVSI